MGEVVGGHPVEVEGESGIVYENTVVVDPNAAQGTADSVGSNSGYNNGAQGE